MRDFSDWYLDYDCMEDHPETPTADEDGFYVLVDYPNRKNNTLLQLLRGSEWAYFDAYVHAELGEGTWIAVFAEDFGPIPWQDNTHTPKPGQWIRILSIKDLNKKTTTAGNESKKVATQSETSEPVHISVEQLRPNNPRRRIEIALRQETFMQSHQKKKKKKVEVSFIISLKSIQSLSHRVSTGGKVDPLQKMQMVYQQPLSLKSAQKGQSTEEFLKQRSERFRQAKAYLEDRMNTEDFKKMRWVKQERKDGIPFFDLLPTLEPIPLESIDIPKISRVLTIGIFPRRQFPQERRLIGKFWKDHYEWDGVARKVAVVWNTIQKESDPRKVQDYWRGVQMGDESGVMKDRLSKRVSEWIETLYVKEWDDRILAHLPIMRKKSRTVDRDLALALYYNEEISDQERDRRWNTLNIEDANKSIDWCNALALAPAPEGWHNIEECTISEEICESICDHWDEKAASIAHIPACHVEIRRQTYDTYWREKKGEALAQFNEKLQEFKLNQANFGQYNLSYITIQVESSEWEKEWEIEKDRIRLSAGHEISLAEIQARKVDRPGNFKEVCKMFGQVDTLKKALEKKIQVAYATRQRWVRNWKSQLSFFQECRDWLRKAKPYQERITSQAQYILKRINKQQEREFQELFPPTPVAEPDHSDLNAAIRKALESHSVSQSPADHPSPKGNGDHLESTRPVENPVKDWNVLGTRGLEPVQMSSHRGPPTDRPPDKPPPWKGAFAGCSQERANTQRTAYRLASCFRGQHCSSGNASPFAANAIKGIRAIEQVCDNAAGPSQRSQSGAEMDASEVWSVQGQRDTCVACNPSPDLGRNLFPPRRFSCHTRFSRFNGTTS
jgi:hypothetical protein